MRFYSDNTATMCPEVLAAIVEANRGLARAYGADEWTQRLDAAFGEYFGTTVRSFVVSTGTAANSLALAVLCPPYGAVYANEEAHILNDECGAPEFFTGGGRLVVVPGPHGKLTPAALARAIDAHPASVHTVQPAAVSLTQATELGTVYSPGELRDIADLAHSRGLRVHMDGARLANAIVHLGCEPADITWRAGMDVLSFGATKNGAMSAEAVVFFDTALVRDFELRRKRAGHLLSKSRYASAQLLAYVQTGAWRRNAARANELTARIAAAAESRLLCPVEANEVFLRLSAAEKSALHAQGFEFYDWGAVDAGEARFVVSWDQEAGDVERLCGALREIVR